MKKNSITRTSVSDSGKSFYIKLVKGISLTLAALCILGMGALLGRFGTLEKMKADSEMEAGKSTSDRIAIVNLDEGVWVNNTNIIYGSRLLADLPENFSLTGLEDARLGYERGLYGGYLVVPSTFSESVVSLNKEPVKTQIQYAINGDLTETAKEKVIFDVMGMIDELNNRVEYMYLHSVLDEVHGIQDNAVTIMENDQTDADMIAAIKPNDLVERITMVPISQIENNIQPVDVLEYMIRNSELTSLIGTKYQEYLSLSKEDQIKLLEEAMELLTEMANMQALMQGIDFAHDGAGNLIYEQGLINIENYFTLHNQTVEDSEGMMRNELNSVSGNMIFLEKGIGQYDQTLNASHEDIAGEIAELILEDYKKKTAAFSVAGQLSADTAKEQQPDQEGLSDGKEELSGEDTQDENEPEETEEFSPDDQDSQPENQPEKTVQSYPEGTEPSPEQAVVSGSFTLYAANAAELEELTELIQAILEEKYPGFGSYVYDNTGQGGHQGGAPPVWPGTMLGFVKNEYQRVGQLLGSSRILAAEPLKREDIETMINDDIMAPIEEKITQTKEAILSQYAIEQEQLGEFQESVRGYDPFSYINQEEIQQITTDMFENGSLLAEANMETDQQQSEYLFNVYQATREDLDVMQETIKTAKEESDLAVEKGLLDIQAVKADNSVENQSILQDFTKKLPYTRLGSLEYQQAYEFIVNPIESSNINATGGIVQPRAQSVKTMNDGVKVTEKKGLSWSQMGVITLGVVTLTCLGIAAKYFARKREDIADGRLL